MFVARALVALMASALLASGAELSGTWSASTNTGRSLAGTWTAEANQGGSVTGAWTLQEASGKIVMRGGWSASKSPQAWNGAWRATILDHAGEYLGTWTAAVKLSPEAGVADMLESALRAVVTGTWKAGSYSGAWSIRASP